MIEHWAAIGRIALGVSNVITCKIEKCRTHCFASRRATSARCLGQQLYNSFNTGWPDKHDRVFLVHFEQWSSAVQCTLLNTCTLYVHCTVYTGQVNVYKYKAQTQPLPLSVFFTMFSWILCPFFRNSFSLPFSFPCLISLDSLPNSREAQLGQLIPLPRPREEGGGGEVLFIPLRTSHVLLSLVPVWMFFSHDT